MKITILKENLKEGLNAVERISSKSLNLPILNNTLISAEKNFLNLTATDLEVGINWWSLVKMEKEGKAVVPTRLLSSFINFLPSKPVKLEVKILALDIECENYKNSIKGFNPEDFPLIPKFTRNEKVEVKSKVFCQSLNQVADMVGYFSIRPELSGVYFLFQKNQITMTATDSFRLGEKKIFLKNPLENISKEYSFILPQRAAKEIINIFGEREDNLAIYFSPNQILFESMLPEVKHPKIQLISRLIDGEYPNYQDVIPEHWETRALLQRADFISQIKIASIFSGKVNEIKLQIDPKKNKVALSSQNPELGEHQSFLTGKVEGKPCEVSFNHKFLLDGLSSLVSGDSKNQEVALELTDKVGLLKSESDKSYLYLIKPMKTTA